MSAASFRVLFVSALLLLALACGPIGPFAGGRLSGEIVRQPVSDWSFSAEQETIQIETRPDDPHSVNTWCVGLGANLYVPSSMILGPTDPSERGWVRHVLDDPRVRIRIGDRVYERSAHRVVDADEYETARNALERKYELDPEDRDPEREIWIFRMDPRTG